MAHYCCAIWSLALYLITYKALRYVGRPMVCGVVYSRYLVDKHTWLQWQGIGFDGSAGLFPCEVPKDLSHLPVELTQHLLLILVGAVPVHDESISFLLLSSIRAWRTTWPVLAPSPETITEILPFIVLFPSMQVPLICHIASLSPFLKVSCLFAKQEDSLVFLSGHRHCKTR